MSEVKLYKDITKWIELIVLSIPSFAIGIWLISTKPLWSMFYIVGLFFTIFFGFCLAIILFNIFSIFDKRAQIIITENGIWDRAIKQNEIKWEQITKAYTLNIFGQKFISLATDETFIFQGKIPKWARKINQTIGAQQLNLSPVKINQEQLSELINQLIKTPKTEREKLIQEFKFTTKTSPVIPNLIKYLLYILVSIGLFILTTQSILIFRITLITMFILIPIYLYCGIKNKYSQYYKYINKFLTLSCINIFLILISIRIYNYMETNLGFKIFSEIEYYQYEFASLPTNLEQIKNDLKLNFVENYFMHKFTYELTENGYKLEFNAMFKQQKIFYTSEF